MILQNQENDLPTRYGITGVKTESGVLALIDWLSVTQSGSQLQQIRLLVQKYFPGGEWEEREKGTTYYRRKALYLHGISVMWEPTTQGRTECNLVLPGSALATIDIYSQLELVQELSNIGSKPTRIDIAVRDYQRTIDPHIAYLKHKEKGVTGFKTGKFFDNCSPKLGWGAAMTFGQRGSKGAGKYLRIYDKYIESLTQDNCIAIELELSDIKAREFWNRLLEIDAESVHELLPQLIAAHIKGAIQFSDWEAWNALLEDVPAMKLPSKKRNTVTLQKAVNWFNKQVKPTFSLIMLWLMENEEMSYDTPDYDKLWYQELWTWIDNGCQRWSPHQKRAFVEAVG